jgi:oligopeptide transport system ATP-binding protein
MSNLLSVRNLVTKFYSDHAVVHAVNGISYNIEEGESLAIVGESGSGKSVSVLSVMGLIPIPPGKIEQGEVIYKGQDLLQLPNQALRNFCGSEIAMIFQDPMTSLNPVLKIGYQITEPMRIHLSYDQSQATERAIELLNLVGIPNPAARLSSYPYQFSGGQRQRLMIAMALSCSPSLLIADEPTTALDVTIQAQIIRLIKSIQREFDMSIIWITHDLGVVAGTVDKVAVMYAGHIVEQAPVREIYKSPAHPYTLGLLQAVPSMTHKKHQRLVSIEGLPPDLRQEPDHCPFAPRCPYQIQRCWSSMPPIVDVNNQHITTCWRWEEIYAETKVGAQT